MIFRLFWNSVYCFLYFYARVIQSKMNCQITFQYLIKKNCYLLSLPPLVKYEACYYYLQFISCLCLNLLTLNHLVIEAINLGFNCL